MVIYFSHTYEGKLICYYLLLKEIVKKEGKKRIFAINYYDKFAINLLASFIGNENIFVNDTYRIIYTYIIFF